MRTAESRRSLLPRQTPRSTPAEPSRPACGDDGRDAGMMAGMQGRAPATVNTCGFGLRALPPGASREENLGLEVDTGTIAGFNIFQTDALAKRLALPHRASESWTELLRPPPLPLSVINPSAPHATAAAPWKSFHSLLTLPPAIN